MCHDLCASHCPRILIGRGQLPFLPRLFQLTRECDQVFEATVNRGGGKGGAAERKNGNCGFKCYICLCAQPSEKSMLIHWESKHDGVELDMERARV